MVDTQEIAARLGGVGYLADEHTCTVLWLAAQLGKPVLVEGPAGTGKTELAVSTARAMARRLIRMQCYEGLDETKALYEWNHSKQLLRILADQVSSAARTGQGTAQGTAQGTGQGTAQWTETGIFTQEFLLTRPLLDAIRSPDPVVLLIDEVDRLDVEAEALLLEVLSDYQVSVPELGTITSTQIPLVFLTSNRSRDLTEALRRRCLYLYLDYPPAEREREIIRMRVPGVSGRLAAQIAAFAGSLRGLELRQGPSVSRVLDWAQTLLALGVQDLDAGLAAESLPELLSYRADLERAAAELAAGQLPGS